MDPFTGRRCEEQESQNTFPHIWTRYLLGYTSYTTMVFSSQRRKRDVAAHAICYRIFFYPLHCVFVRMKMRVSTNTH